MIYELNQILEIVIYNNSYVTYPVVMIGNRFNLIVLLISRA